MLTPEQLAERMKAEIVADIRNGTVPISVAEFSQLHDYVDANCYGGTEALLEQIENELPPSDDAGHIALMKLCEIMNPAIAIVDAWLRNGGAEESASEPVTAGGPFAGFAADVTVIPRISDQPAYQANMEAIDRIVHTNRYRYIVAWGKWLGFTPSTVKSQVDAAYADNAPTDAIQKIDGNWLTLGDIENAANRRAVEKIATGAHRAQ